MKPSARWHGLQDRAVDWLIARIPSPVLINPERVAIKTAVAIIGLIALIFVRPSSLNALLPGWTVDVWGVAWMLGGSFGLVGYWRNNRTVEAAGHRLIILGAAVYAIAIVVVVGSPGYASVVLMALIAGCSIIRLLVAAGAKRTRQRGR